MLPGIERQKPHDLIFMWNFFIIVLGEGTLWDL
jgi:hypothetical protein